MSNLQGKIAVVTGGNSGIGYASAQELKEKGAQVIITGRSEEKIKQAAHELGVKGLVADVSNIQAVEQRVAQIQEEFNKIM